MQRFFIRRILRACLRALARRLAISLALLTLWPLLSSAAPAPAVQPCTESTAAVVLRQAVERDVRSNGVTIRVPAGFVAAWSCVSRAEAEAELARLAAQVR